MVPGSFPPIGPEIEEIVKKRGEEIFSKLLKIRREDSREKLVLLTDSITDLRVFTIISELCAKNSLKAEIIYFITNFHDSPSETEKYLRIIKEHGTETRQLDILRPDKEILGKVVELFSQTNASAAIANLLDDYDVRQAINDYAGEKKIPILEVPSIDMVSFTSGVFSVDTEKMKLLGNSINEELSKYENLVFISSDGTYLKLSLNPNWLNEGVNDFSNRYWDDIKEVKFETFPQDNPPGEVYTNIRNANGRLVLYQLDNEVSRYIVRNKEYLPFACDIEDPLLITCDLADPIAMNIKDGAIDLDSIDTSQSTRAKMLKYFLEQKQKEDEYYVTTYTKRANAASIASELGFGINAYANNPDEEPSPGIRIDSTLITEKKLGIWHIAFGNTPCPDKEEYFNHSSSHIDCGMRNPDLYVFGFKNDQRILLFSTKEELNGKINEIIRNSGQS